MRSTSTARRIQVATEWLERAGHRYSKAIADAQIARNLGYWGTVLEAFDNVVDSSRLVVDAAYRALQAERANAEVL